MIVQCSDHIQSITNITWVQTVSRHTNQCTSCYFHIKLLSRSNGLEEKKRYKAKPLVESLVHLYIKYICIKSYFFVKLSVGYNKEVMASYQRITSIIKTDNKWKQFSISVSPMLAKKLDDSMRPSSDQATLHQDPHWNNSCQLWCSIDSHLVYQGYTFN